MKYELLLKLGCFSRSELGETVGNLRTADSLIYNYKKKGLIVPVKQNLYVVKSLETNDLMLNIFEIACHASPSAYISNHSAFEFNGMQNQVFNTIYVCSPKPFKTFEFDYKTIKFLPSPFDDGVETCGKHIRITNMERTFVDSVKNINSIAGYEELFNNLECVDSFDFHKIKTYLLKYSNPFLYQKTGFILELFKDILSVPQDILDF